MRKASIGMIERGSASKSPIGPVAPGSSMGNQPWVYAAMSASGASEGWGRGGAIIG